MINKEDFKNEKYYDNYVDAYKLAKDKEYGNWIDDIPVHQNLLSFYREFKYKRPNIVVSVNQKVRRITDDVFGYESLDIAYKESPDVVVGSIHGSTDDDNPCYSVTSVKIVNERYAEYNSLYHTKKTKKLVNAMKIALQYLKPYTMQDMVYKTTNDRERALSRLKESARDNLYYGFNADRNELFDEACHMAAMGYVPKNPKFAEMIEKARLESAEIKEMLSYQPRACFVWALVDRIEYKYDDEQNVNVCSNFDTLPEEIRNRIAVLQIADKESSIKDVGVKVSPTQYWLFL